MEVKSDRLGSRIVSGLIDKGRSSSPPGRITQLDSVTIPSYAERKELGVGPYSRLP